MESRNRRHAYEGIDNKLANKVAGFSSLVVGVKTAKQKSQLISKPSEQVVYHRTACCRVCMVVTDSRVWINQVRLPVLLVVSSTEKMAFSCLRSRLRIWSRETGSVVPSRVSLPILYIKAESGAYYNAITVLLDVEYNALCAPEV